MKIVEISYGVTLNLGNFESARVDATARIEDGEDPPKAFADLKEFVDEEAKGVR